MDKKEEFKEYFGPTISRDFTDGCETNICEYPYIGSGNKPNKKPKKRILSEDEIERLTY